MTTTGIIANKTLDQKSLSLLALFQQEIFEIDGNIIVSFINLNKI